MLLTGIRLFQRISAELLLLFQRTNGSLQCSQIRFLDLELLADGVDQVVEVVPVRTARPDRCHHMTGRLFHSFRSDVERVILRAQVKLQLEWIAPDEFEGVTKRTKDSSSKDRDENLVVGHG